jgi:type IV pilus assembly protein PilY1
MLRLATSFIKRRYAVALALGLIHICSAAQVFNPVQAPSGGGSNVPGNVALALSVEFPTGLQISYTSESYNFTSVVANRYDGLFDNRLCYAYIATTELFDPKSAITAAGDCSDDTHWSGDVLNWLTMTNLDQFRKALTGGTRDTFTAAASLHPGDSTTATVLLRSFSDRDGYDTIKKLPTNAFGVPSAFVGKAVRSGGYGTKFLIALDNESDFKEMSATEQREACSARPAESYGKCFNVRVLACKPVVGVILDQQCTTSYSGVAKPEGLIQQYNSNMRFAALGYQNVDSNEQSGGVIRAAMKSVGPTAYTTTGFVVNAETEWNNTTGILVSNPNSTDAAASEVTNSGVMNYLNKFGYAAGLKGLDPVSELYYATQLYLRGQGSPTAYSNISGLTPAEKTTRRDGFPILSGTPFAAGGARDPVLNSCQKNFIIGIGDIFTHCDGNLPGAPTADCPGGLPSDPAGLNVQNLWKNVTDLEGTTEWFGGADRGTPYMAGLAHWANTNDIRPDLPGKQTIRTYWVDVLEGDNYQANSAAASLVKSQFWFTAKYGGFDTSKATGNNPNTNALSWDANGDGIPDTWFAGNSPKTLREGLSSAFASIAASIAAGSAGGAAVSSRRSSAGSLVFLPGFDPNDWSGVLNACTQSQSSASCLANPTWSASAALTTETSSIAPENRKIIGHLEGTTPSTGTDFVFRWANLPASYQTLLNAGDSRGEERLDYLRGVRSSEQLRTNPLRKRGKTVLGDIVNSGLTLVSGRSVALNGPKFPNHASYRTLNALRPGVIYSGSNDGMMHAFDASNGKELFGFIPSTVAGKLNGLTNPAFNHNYLVDSTPMAGDVENGNTWTTIITGGLGGGGRGIYALDIGNQGLLTTQNETALKDRILWEMTSTQDPDLGFTFNEPYQNPITSQYQQIAKIATSVNSTGTWVVFYGNGYGSTNGKAILYGLDPLTGASTVKLEAGANSGTTLAINGLSAPTPVDTDGDGLVDTVYAGDLKGTVHKFQFSKLQGSALVLATAGDSSGSWKHVGKLYETGRPITSAPSVSSSCEGDGINVMVGTGKLLETSDETSQTTEKFVALFDRSTSSFSLTINTGDLATVNYSTDNVAGLQTRELTNPPDLSAKKGWVMNFTNGERIIANSTVPPDTGAISFPTHIPNTASCDGGASGFVMAVNVCKPKSALVVKGVTVAGLGGIVNGVLKLTPSTINDSGKSEVNCNQAFCREVGGTDGKPLFKSAGSPAGRYNWREIIAK